MLSISYFPMNANAEESGQIGYKSNISNIHLSNWPLYINNPLGIKLNHPPYLKPIKISTNLFNQCNNGEKINLSMIHHIFRFIFLRNLPMTQ